MKRFLLIVTFLVMGSSLEAQSVGELLFKENCVSCHGIVGQGDGQLSAGLGTAPADLTKIAARRSGVWPML